MSPATDTEDTFLSQNSKLTNQPSTRIMDFVASKLASNLAIKPNAALSQTLLSHFKSSFRADPKNLVAMNTACRTDLLNSMLLRRDLPTDPLHHHSIRVEPENKVSNQKASGRCWIFAGLNVTRQQMAKRYRLDSDWELSQGYLFFWDKLEKANYLLEAIEETAEQPLDSRLVQHLLIAPVQDGGQWGMLCSLVAKYGLVPKSIYGESFNATNSRTLNTIITSRLREGAMQIRNMISNKAAPEKVKGTKTAILEDIYRVLTIGLGEPPNSNTPFDWVFRDKDKQFHRYPGLTPLSFAKDYAQADSLILTTVSLVNDPRHPYYALYTVQYLGNVVDADNPVLYINLPIDELKKYAIKELLDGKSVWFGSDVGKYISKSLGLLSQQVFDYELVFGFSPSSENSLFKKAERLMYGESAMTHAMTITGVNIDGLVQSKKKDEKNSEDKLEKEDKIVDSYVLNSSSYDPSKHYPTHWRVENSWGEDTGDKGFYTMTDDWFNEYVFQVVIHKSFLPVDILNVLKGEPVVLPPWDPMGALA